MPVKFDSDRLELWVTLTIAFATATIILLFYTVFWPPFCKQMTVEEIRYIMIQTPIVTNV